MSCVRLLAVVALLVAAAVHAQGPPPRRPNVVLIVFDALRADRVGAFGNRRGLTPFLDSLAEHAYVFHRAYSTAPYTVASIASLLTSRRPSAHGVAWFQFVLAEDELTLAEVLHSHGYSTAAFTGNLLFIGVRQGFDAMEKVTAEERDYPPLADVAMPALAWYARQPRHRRPLLPAYVYLHFMDTHGPYAPDSAMLQRLAAGRSAPDPAKVNERAASAHRAPLTADELRDLRDVYDATVMTGDAALQRWFTAPASRELLDDAIVVVTADHGEELGDHGLVGHGGVLYESSVRVPLLIMLPGQTRHVDVDEVVSLLDVAPTIVDLLGLPVPVSFEGRSLAATLREREHPWQVAGVWARVRRWMDGPSEAVIENILTQSNAGVADPPHLRAIVRGTRKLIVGSRGERLYYDLRADPGERNPDALDAASRADLDQALAAVEESARQRPPSQERIWLDDDTKQRLKALGYTAE